jgi:hypothetical protein
MAALGRKHILDTAAAAVLSDRNKAYGNPEDNFGNIADVWNWWIRTRINQTGDLFGFTPSDVAYMMILMKMARLKTNPTHADSVVDVAGYAATAGDFLYGKEVKLADVGITPQVAEKQYPYTEQATPKEQAEINFALRATAEGIGIVRKEPDDKYSVKIGNGKRYLYDATYWYYDYSTQSLQPQTQDAIQDRSHDPIELP